MPKAKSPKEVPVVNFDSPENLVTEVDNVTYAEQLEAEDADYGDIDAALIEQSVQNINVTSDDDRQVSSTAAGESADDTVEHTPKEGYVLVLRYLKLRNVYRQYSADAASNRRDFSVMQVRKEDFAKLNIVA